MRNPTNEGREKTRNLIRCCLCFGGAVGLLNNCMGTFVNAIRTDLALSTGSASFMITLMNLSSAAFMPLTSHWMVRRPLRKLMSFGSILAAVCLLIVSMSSSLPLFYAACIGMGAGQCMLSILPVTFVLMSWYGQKSGSATGIAMAGSGLFGALANPLLSQIITRSGWRIAVIVQILVFLTMTLPAAMGIRKGNAVPSIQAKVKKQPRDHFSASYALIYMGSVLFSYIGALNPHMSMIGTETGYPLAFASWMVSLSMAANILSKFLLGWLSDRISPMHAVSLFLLISISGMILLLEAESSRLAALMGALLFGFIASTFTVGIAVLTRAAASEQYNGVFSAANMLVSLSYALSASILGALRDIGGSYDLALWTCLAAASAGIVCCQFLYLQVHRSSGNKGGSSHGIV